MYSYLTYCNEVWGNACSTHIDPGQDRDVRSITCAHYLGHKEQLFFREN